MYNVLFYFQFQSELADVSPLLHRLNVWGWTKVVASVLEQRRVGFRDALLLLPHLSLCRIPGCSVAEDGSGAAFIPTRRRRGLAPHLRMRGLGTAPRGEATVNRCRCMQ